MVDKLDYCATLNNLTFAKDNPNFKVSADRMHLLPSCCDGHLSIYTALICVLQFIKGDIQSGDLLSYILDTEKIDTVMHFAAQVCPCAMPLLTIVTASLETYCSPSMQLCAKAHNT